MDSTRTEEVETLQADIVVIGGGGAGLGAAVAAAEKGASVIVLEKRKAPGGNSALAQAFFAADSPVQERLGINAPKDVLFRMAMDYAHWEINPRIVRAFINKSGDTVRWLEEKGLKIDRMPAYPPGITMRTFHWPEGQGAAIVDVLLKDCEKLGVRLLRQTAAEKISLNSGGKVAGVSAKGKERDFQIGARCVVIATDGYGGNRELLSRYCSSYTEDIRSMGVPLKGDGLKMALQAGAATEGLGVIQMEGPIFQGARNGSSICQEATTIWVNKRGERFTDEATALNHFESVNAVLQQPGKVSYSLFDERIKELIIDKIERKVMNFRGLLNRPRTAEPPDLPKELLQEVGKGTVKISHSLDEIAQWIGADLGVLQSTVNAYNRSCERGYDELFVKEGMHLVPLTVPPYYAMRCYPVFLTTIGGIKINHRMEVVDGGDNPITGLYAAGNDTGGWEPSTYNAVLSGSTLGFALNSGRIAGENAAGFVSGE